MKKITVNLPVALLSFVVISAAHAQATRTWVSGVGDDVNPCSRTAPCKTFAGAISKTAAAGEISVLDPGGFGALTITKSITVNGGSSLAGVLNASVNGFTINAGATDVVVLKNLTINGSGSGLDGIRYVNAGQVIVEDTAIIGQTANAIEIATNANANLTVRNSNFEGGVTGVKINSTSSPISVSLNKVSIKNFTNGVEAQTGNVDISDSVVTQNTGTGLLASGGSITGQNNMITGNGTAVQSQSGGVANIDKSTLSGNAVAVIAQAGSTVRISGNNIFNNQTGLACGGGTVASTGDNRKGSNTGGSLPVCAPTATIALQ
jgi:hypothetical protein